MKQVVRWLGVLLVASIVIRVSAQLLTPAMPLLVTLFAMGAGAYYVFRRRS